ncbi:ubiquitin-protein ligase-like protein [Eremomyces bilateralis CBS 781.70]|uniref:Ubiquitin-protein ligase-like protein n=1 Tax=Eremomyces bilateralis CBS 781.70 TaxID=1392243 RepID=A0A6G1GH64_9PEZI|nr:ubiquitin-protein ligase-like protein [Eremomyces bilateralis CBS 781.70]KAF1817445.1 ubiquitin-protein ligase-like protein [Eremomyces bilateralis CBS 781.70]
MELDTSTDRFTNAMNATSYFAPSGMDLLMAIPRLARRAGALAFYYVPEHLDGFVGKIRDGGSVIADPTTSNTINATITNGSKTFIQSATGGLAPAISAAAGGGTAESAGGIFSLQNFRNLGGLFSYVTSKWALTTFIVGLILNRTQFYASSRVPLRLNWIMRLSLYLMPILVMIHRIHILFQAIRCQTSPDWSELRYGNATKHIGTDYAGEGGILYSISSTTLFWEDDAASCRGVNMGGFEDKNLIQLSGSLAMLWPLFLSFGLNAFVENLACALQGRQPMAETGMTTFEHSLAFAEAESAVLRPFELLSKLAPTELHPDSSVSTKLTRALAMQILNVAPEVLAVSLISSLNHLSSHILAVLGIRNRFRLLNTGIWGMAYMSTFVWSFFSMTMSEELSVNLGLLRFPTVCIIGFVPHLVILWGISVCATIYAMALLITALAPPLGRERPQTLKERFKFAYQNLQANVYLSTGTPIVLRWQDDFYTTLLKTGFTLLTCASEAVYLNEGSTVNVHRATWLEEKRLDELAASKGLHQRAMESVPAGLRSDMIAQGLSSIDDQTAEDAARFASSSGYARERKAKGGQAYPDIAQAPIRDRGVGVFQRHGRWLLSLRFLKSIFWLCAGLHARALISVMNTLGISYVPLWLRRVAGTRSRGRKPMEKSRNATAQVLKFWVLTEDGELRTPTDRNVDVEAEMRRRTLNGEGAMSGAENEGLLDHDLYNWWTRGGWWGDIDASGDYQTPEQEDDLTSVVSTITDLSSVDDLVDEDEDGRRTPTQLSPFPSRQSTPINDDLLDRTRLASLLNPQSSEEQHEAHLLSRRLLRDSPMTRSQYRRELDRERSRVLLSRRGAALGSRGGPSPTAISPEEEEKILERFILERRDAAAQQHLPGENGAWESGAEGMGAAGPQCVVCQFSPRTTLLWPCGCLSLCDDCRVGLATRNFNTCVCCRTDVVAYSRLYVP